MKVLWITNIVFPEANQLLMGSGALKATGGWLIGAAEALVQKPDVSLIVAAVSKKVKKLTRLEGEQISYYLLPYGKGNQRLNYEYEPLWKEIREAVQPDVVHIHGTEFTHGLAYVDACSANNVCVSIQGLVSVYARYYCAGLSKKEIRSAVTPASLIKGGILSGQKTFVKRGEYERELLRRVHHILGRTSWDKAHAWAINPNATYHYAGETLRDVFYGDVIWQYESCTPHSIFLSQAYYPIKGLHKVLEAMPLILKHYPDTTIRIAGGDISRRKGWKEFLKLSDYGRIIRRLIEKNKLHNHVTFLGPLDGCGMRNEYLKCNVFVCPSIIENSPNSIGEAQLLGVPVIASYEGGVMDMMQGDENHLYRYEETESLAYKVVELFLEMDKVKPEKMRQEALRRHDRNKNASSLLQIYDEIIKKDK